MGASPRRIALHFHLPSYRCVAVRIRCASVGTKRLYSISFRSYHSESSQFRCQSQRVLSVSCHCRHRLASPSRSHALHFLSISLRIATSLFRSFAGLTRGAVSAYCGSRGQSSLSTSSHSKRPLPLLRHWNRPRSTP